jgi:hypothetical protein
MTKAEIRSAIKNSLKRYDKTASAHDKVIDNACETVLNTMYGEVFRMSPHSLQRFCKEYGYAVPLTVLAEASTGIYYTTLPVNVVYIPDRSSGVRRVAPATQIGIKFYPMDQREWDLVMVGSYVNYVKDKIGYIVTPTRVEYYGITGAIITSGVRMDVLPVFSSYADTDVVLVPEHKDENGLGFIDRVVEKFRDKPAVDLLDTNKDEETK